MKQNKTPDIQSRPWCKTTVLTTGSNRVSVTEEVFEKDMRAVVQALLPDAVSWDELLKETSRDPELKELKTAIDEPRTNANH